MGEKSEQKKELILEKAREIFAQKGFKDVTMKDIVDACEISRGGLYLYYGSTAEVFLDVLQAELDREEDSIGKNVGKLTMSDILLLFLKEQKKEILRKKNSLTIAAYEYYFENKPQKSKDNLLKTQMDMGIEVLAKILEEGVNREEFYCPDSKAAARNIMFTMEGMKVSAKTMGISEKTVDEELLYILGGLVIEED